MSARRGIDEPLAGRDWRSKAACRAVDPELFFPTSKSGPLLDAQVAAAKRVCATCRVRPECLADALERLSHGVAGGLTEQERRRARRESSRAPQMPRWRALLEAGRPQAEIARRCGVSVRTIERWAAAVRDQHLGVGGDRP